MTTATTTTHELLIETGNGDGAESRVARRLLDNIYHYTHSTATAAKYAAYVRDDMAKVGLSLHAGNRVYDADVTSWHERLQQEVNRRHRTAEAINDGLYMLCWESEQIDALWDEIEGKVAELLNR